MEDKDSNPNPFEFNKITEYLNEKSEKYEKFKQQLKKITNILQKNYQELYDFYNGIPLQNLEIKSLEYHYAELLKNGFEFLKRQEPLKKYLLSLFDPEELDINKIIEQYKKKIEIIHYSIYNIKKLLNGRYISVKEKLMIWKKN